MAKHKRVTVSPHLIQRRIAISIFLLLSTMVLLVGRIGWIQFVEGKNLTNKIQNQLVDHMVLQSPRGTIYDRHGRELAISSMTKSLYANVTEFNHDRGYVANLLAPTLGMKAEDIEARLTPDARFVWIKRTLDANISDRVIKLIHDNNIKGLNFVEESKRYYPNDTLAAQVLGFVGTDDVGLEGVEMSMDKVIKGQLSQTAMETDSHGTPIFHSIFNFMPHKQVKNIQLTIDSTIQFIVEQSLDKVMAANKPKSATVIIMNPRTGEILAMASRPGYNPNQFGNFSENEWKNRAVSSIYEPGSTFKSLVSAAALQEGTLNPTDHFNDPGFIEVSGRRIQNWSGDGAGDVSFQKALEDSINTVFVQIGMKLGADRLMQYAHAFGLGKVTGIELPGEEEGLLFDPHNMRDSDVATTSIGQSIAVTPLQLITADSAIANDGVLVKPHMIKEIQNADGTVEQATPVQVVRQVVNSDVAHELAGLMEKVISEGGGKNGYIPGYRFAGKTGTAQRLREDGKGYEDGHYIASFAGFGPLDDPQLAIIIVIDDPTGMYYGGEIAAPVFKDIMSQVLRYLNIPPHVDAPQPSAAPLAGSVAVPDLTGKNVREVTELLSSLKLGFVPDGSGVAVKQSIAANTRVAPGTAITVTFAVKQ